MNEYPTTSDALSRNSFHVRGLFRALYASGGNIVDVLKAVTFVRYEVHQTTYAAARD